MSCEGITFLSSVPMRAQPTEKSEMVSQLLFGERFEIIDQTEKWLDVRSKIDGYQGWVSKNMVDLNSKITFSEVECSAFSVWTVNGVQRILPGGCFLPDNAALGTFEINCEQYNFYSRTNTFAEKSIANFAKQYLGAPYLWGGKTILGIDCSALVQIACRMAGFWIARDAWQQQTAGQAITPEDAETDNLAFFCDDNGKIIHTGIICNKNSIIHASGLVRVDKFDKNGIFNVAENKYTHKLHSIRGIH